jgi:hypothetical protein
VTYFLDNMDSTNPHKAALSNATAFNHKNPNEKASAAAQIYSVNDNTVRQALFRERQRDGKAAQHGGHNRILSDVQIDAIYKYVEDSYMNGYGATKLMVHAAMGCLKANQVPPREQPSSTQEWARFPRSTSACDGHKNVLDINWPYAVQLVQQVNFGPLESKRYFLSKRSCQQASLACEHC